MGSLYFDRSRVLARSLQQGERLISCAAATEVTLDDWLPALATAIARRDVSDPNDTAWLPHERVSPGFALAAYTQSIARQALASDRGTLDVGQVADLVWLSRNPLELNPEDIVGISVRGTWFAGERVY